MDAHNNGTVVLEAFSKEDKVWSWHLDCRYEASRLRLAENGRRRQCRFPRSNIEIG